MPFSDQSNQKWVVDTLSTLDITSMLDIGAGAGIYGKLFREHFPKAQREAVEAWEPYIAEYRLNDLYQVVHHTDVKNHSNFNFDIVIFGDVLEHMTKSEALEIWEKTAKSAKFALISIPIVHYPQDEVFNNPYEKHVKDDWSHDEVLSSFPQIKLHATSGVVGSYIAFF